MLFNKFYDFQQIEFLWSNLQIKPLYQCDGLSPAVLPAVAPVALAASVAVELAVTEELLVVLVELVVLEAFAQLVELVFVLFVEVLLDVHKNPVTIICLVSAFKATLNAARIKAESQNNLFLIIFEKYFLF